MGHPGHNGRGPIGPGPDWPIPDGLGPHEHPMGPHGPPKREKESVNPVSLFLIFVQMDYASRLEEKSVKGSSVQFMKFLVKMSNVL